MCSAGFGFDERVLRTERELKERAELLSSRGLMVPEEDGLIIGLYESEHLIATGTLVRNVLQGIAVDRAYEGEGAAAAIVSSLIKHAIELNIEKLMLFTMDDEETHFENLGFSLVAKVPRGAALLEWGSRGIVHYLTTLRAVARDDTLRAGAVVVNCNPFTKGHRALIEYAASQVPWLYVFVVEEDRSLFPFKVRFQLVRDGTADLTNVTVFPGGPYIISSATFPTYFIRLDSEMNNPKKVMLHATLDLVIFRTWIAPSLGIAQRFVGTEPFCATTSLYNKIMKKVLPTTLSTEMEEFGLAPATKPVEVVEIPRYEMGGEAVSASKVRVLIREGHLSEVEKLVPPTTWKWLTGPEATSVLEKIRQSDSRH